MLGRGGDIHWHAFNATASTREAGVEWVVFPVNERFPLYRSSENEALLYRCIQGVRLVLEEKT